ncbi:unnamed protein product [Brassicogethes aeneus]|uniref:Multiple inositol polyphosphate phosphatase 1 n=1 Tax=Brassicogethes aeneus TaxID=1431903 RepID=A0A9P0BIH3_BRAAE|nr:unnamed protein product [Brassicogethes aeneus]
MFKLLLTLCFIAVIDVSFECTNTVYPFEKYLATKTPYRVVANNTFGKLEYEGCKAIKSWMIVRHGTRNPSDGFVLQYNTRLPDILNLIVTNYGHGVSENIEKISPKDIDLLKKWRSKVGQEDAKKLREEGEDEMILISERMQTRFPEVFPNVYSNTSYKFKYTHTQRTKKSAQYFATGLFGKKTAKDVWFPLPLKRDPILRFYKLCSKWRNTIKKQPIMELELFKKSSHFLELVDNVNKKIGAENVLNAEDVLLMYFACAFETAWNKVLKSPWCSVFTIDDLKVLEYHEDLKYYWIDGYGHQLTYQQACPAIVDMVEHFDNKEKYPLSVLYFTHSGTLLKMLAHLGLYKDEKILIANDYEKNGNREWKVSHIDAFATNLAFILHKCGDEEKVLTLHQENVVRLPSCPDSDLCDLQKFKEFYTDSVDHCDFNSMCDTV